MLLLQVVELDLSTVTPSLSGPKRPHDRVSVSEMKQDFTDCLNNKVGFKGFGIPTEKQSTEVPFTFDGQEFKLSHGKHLYLSLNFLDILGTIIGHSDVKDIFVTSVVVVVVVIIVTISNSEGCNANVVKRGLEYRATAVTLNQ